MINWLNEKTKKYPYKMAIFGALVPYWVWHVFFVEVTFPNYKVYDAAPLGYDLYTISMIFFLRVLLAPLVEELIWRKFLWWLTSSIFRFKGGGVITLFVITLGFAYTHDSPHIIFPIGLFFGYLRLKTGSIKPSIVAHMLWNLSVWIRWTPWSNCGFC